MSFFGYSGTLQIKCVCKYMQTQSIIHLWIYLSCLLVHISMCTDVELFNKPLPVQALHWPAGSIVLTCWKYSASISASLCHSTVFSSSPNFWNTTRVPLRKFLPMMNRSLVWLILISDKLIRLISGWPMGWAEMNISRASHGDDSRQISSRNFCLGRNDYPFVVPQTVLQNVHVDKSERINWTRHARTFM